MESLCFRTVRQFRFAVGPAYKLVMSRRDRKIPAQQKAKQPVLDDKMVVVFRKSESRRFSTLLG
jgi:hypothetical protein